MVSLMRVGGAAVLFAVAGACHSVVAGTWPWEYPNAGFGRMGCFAGPGLSRFHPDSTRPSPEVAAKGPWLVLDSLDVRKWRDDANPASLVQRRDSLEVYWARWVRVAPDSIRIDEGTYPPVSWRFRFVGDELRGEGVFTSDVMNNTSDADRAAKAGRWTVRLARVACSAVPRAR